MNGKQLLIGTALFSAGVLTSNAIKHTAANFVADQALPNITVSYQRSGTYVNGERVDSLGRVGGARCDWSDIGAEARMNYVLDELHDNKQLASTFIGKLSTEDQRNVFYRTGVQLARKAGGSISDEIARMKEVFGFRWELQYPQDSLLRR